MSLKRTYATLIIGYLTIIFLILLASYLIPRPEARGVLRSLFTLLLFPCLPLLPMTALLRQRILAAILVLPVLLWLIIYGPLLLPRAPSVNSDSPRFTVLTFNVQTASNNLDSLAALIQTTNADIVALQELSQPAARFLEQALQDTYPHQALYPQSDAHQGQGLLTRFPLIESEYWRNEQIYAALGHMWAQVDIAGQRVTVFNTHPAPPLSFETGITLQPHSQEIAILLERALDVQTPVLLLGDFNMTQMMDEYQQVTEYFTDTFREAGSPGLGFSFPAGQRLPLPPVVRLDYIFHSRHFQGVFAYPLAQSGISDHLPFWAELNLVQ